MFQNRLFLLKRKYCCCSIQNKLQKGPQHQRQHQRTILHHHCHHRLSSPLSSASSFPHAFSRLFDTTDTTTTIRRKTINNFHPVIPYEDISNNATGRRYRLFTTTTTRSVSSSSTTSTSNLPINSSKDNDDLDEKESKDDDPYQKALSKLPKGGQIHFDFFGEPVTFLSTMSGSDLSNVVASLDVFEIGIATKGKAFTGGGEEDGINIQSSHSCALGWCELLRHAHVLNHKQQQQQSPSSSSSDDNENNNNAKSQTMTASAPMLSYVATAPILAQTGVGYLKYLDSLLEEVESGIGGHYGERPIQMYDLAVQAASMKDHELINERERAHLLALDCMLRHDHKRAMLILMKHLEVCPGDGLALSIVLDLAHTVGDPNAALRASGSVAAYWNERRGGIIRPSIPGYNTASALISLGLAVGGRRTEAEQIAVFAMDKSEKLAGGIATWALAHIMDGEGRTSEGISACANSDGIRNFESCGLLFFHTILSGYGVRFALDREERGRGRSAALRLYDNNYQMMLEQTGFSMGIVPVKVMNRAPIGWKRSSFDKKKKNDKKSHQTFLADLLGKPTTTNEDGQTANQQGGDDNDDDSGEVVVNHSTKSLPELRGENWTPPTCEDVLTWLPPTPQVLADATLLLLRLTLNGTISSKNFRWDNLRNAWTALITLNRRHAPDELQSFEFYPLVCVAASLLASPKQVGSLSGPGGRLATALHKMGELLDLGDISLRNEDGDDKKSTEDDEDGGFLSTVLFKEIVADKEPDFWLPVQEESKKEEWRTVLKLLSSAIDGIYDPTGEGESDVMLAELGLPFQAWEFDVRPVLEHATVYAACKCGDTESLSLARSICSRGVTLRQNSPEEWWRYSIVLGLLGDQVASEDALANSLRFGGGQGARLDDVT